jgi:hypothetical protein
MEDICPIKPCNCLSSRDKCAFICDVSPVAKTVESTTEGIADDIFAYIFFDKLFIRADTYASLSVQHRQYSEPLDL